MSPDEKAEVVERLQHLDYTVGFCGDGANDCGALKAADVGLSLSEAEASVAAPFTSRSTDISCFIDVIREGRAALVTSFSCFKFMALYSLIQFTTVTLLYALASSLGDFQFLYIDLAIIIPIAITMGRTEAFGRLHPKGPTANLVSKKVLTSLLGHVFLTSGLQLFVFLYVRSQSFYEPPFIDPDELDTVSYENSALFLISSFQYIIVAVVFCVGPPYRKPIHSNILLLITLVILAGFSTYTVFVHYGVIFNMLGLVYLPREFQLELFLLAILNTGVSWLWEKHLVLPVAGQIGQLKRRIRRWRGGKRERDGKLYKLIQRDLDD
jgi:cation-transporting ATPase 13A3/4/5